MTLVAAKDLKKGDEIQLGMHIEIIRAIDTDKARLRVHTDRTQPARPHRFLPLEKVELVRQADSREADPTSLPAEEYEPEKPPAQVVQMGAIEEPPSVSSIGLGESGSKPHAGSPPADMYQKPTLSLWDNPGRRFKLQKSPYLAVGYFGDDAVLYSKKPDGERIFVTYLRHEEMMTLLFVYHSEED